jgi:hypothetical protein
MMTGHAGRHYVAKCNDPLEVSSNSLTGHALVFAFADRIDISRRLTFPRVLNLFLLEDILSELFWKMSGRMLEHYLGLWPMMLEIYLERILTSEQLPMIVALNLASVARFFHCWF